jgi:[acyl-carrier-protein] S-malonyltransferase
VKTAFLFPGQATDIADAVDAWRASSSHVDHLLDVAAHACGVDEVSTRPAALARTSVFQPVLTALTIGIHRELVDRGVTPDIVAGHSVGEIAACVAAGLIRDEDAVRLAAQRGALMERQAALHGGGMIAVKGSASDIDSAIAAGSAHGRVAIAIHNATDEWVLSGDAAALRTIGSVMHATPLDTPGPWHSGAMADAVEPYREAIRGVADGVASIPVVWNRTGEVARDGFVVDLLAEQLTSPVQWVRTMETLRSTGVTRVIICGPGKSLRRFARSILPSADISIVAHPADLPNGAIATARS